MLSYQHAVILKGGRGNTFDHIHSALQTSFPTSTIFDLTTTSVKYCTGCFECWHKTPGVCVIRDGVQDINTAIMQNDFLILLTPITFGGYSSALKRAVDHFIPLISPFFTHINGEVHHHKRYQRYPAYIAIGVQTKPNLEQERIFRKLVERNAINFHAPAHASAVLLADDRPETVTTQIQKMLDSVMEAVQ